jgi:uncharacterized protein (TIGR04551 family)
MPAAWGLGILQNAGSGLNDDFGDTVDRLQFALPPVSTPVGPLTVVPSLDFDSEGAQQFNALGGPPIDADNADDARSWGLKLARLDTPDELRRKHDKGEASFNYGAFYQYKAQVWVFPAWIHGVDAPGVDGTTSTKRNAYAHVMDVWSRWLKGPFKAEVEVAGIFGHIGNGNAQYGYTVTPGTGVIVVDSTPTGEIMLRQLGLAANFEWAFMPNKLTFGGEAGFASGDDAPGFGNQPGLGQSPYGSLDGQQWGDFAGRDRSIRNFRFNPAYRVDVILFREILGGVTDAWYVKPKLHWDVMPAIAFDGGIIFSAALKGESTPSASGPGTGKTTLGLEGDAKFTYTSGDGFQAWIEYGILQPFDALQTMSGITLARAHALNIGLAAKF